MKIIRHSIIGLVTLLTIAHAGFALAALTAEEAAQLGKDLTMFGAIKAGNADGSIPEYTGGLTKVPAGYDGKGNRPDPYPDEKPLFSINTANMDKYSEKLTEGTKALMKKYPEFQVNVYKTHRSVWYPQWILDRTVQMATKTKLAADGINVEGGKANIMFPIPKSGAEAMWGHITRWQGLAVDTRSLAYLVDRSGRSIIVGGSDPATIDYPFWDVDTKDLFVWKSWYYFIQPARQAGEMFMWHETLDDRALPRKVWQYLPGQRRVKLAPELTFDTPNVQEAGLLTYDEEYGFNGSLERFNWKLLGTKEMYVPYNCYRLVYDGKKSDLMQNYVNPDSIRFELHRVYVVEATLKEGQRHCYHKRVFYIDEDSKAIVAAENYDPRLELQKVNLFTSTPMYESGGIFSQPCFSIDIMRDAYVMTTWEAGTDTEKSKLRWAVVEKKPASWYTPGDMTSRGAR